MILPLLHSIITVTAASFDTKLSSWESITLYLNVSVIFFAGANSSQTFGFGVYLISSGPSCVAVPYVGCSVISLISTGESPSGSRSLSVTEIVISSSSFTSYGPSSSAIGGNTQSTITVTVAVSVKESSLSWIVYSNVAV